MLALHPGRRVMLRDEQIPLCVESCLLIELLNLARVVRTWDFKCWHRVVITVLVPTALGPRVTTAYWYRMIIIDDQGNILNANNTVVLYTHFYSLFSATVYISRLAS